MDVTAKTRNRPNSRAHVRASQSFPVLPVTVACLLALSLIGAGIWLVRNQGPATVDPNAPQPTIAGVKCNTTEQLKQHVHAHLSIVIAGQAQTIPANIGIPQDATGNPTCFYWLHTHPTSQGGAVSDGVIHIESPSLTQKFTLGQFFQVWGQTTGTSKPLTKTNVGGVPVPAGSHLTMIVDGQPYTGDPSKIQLASHQTITLEVGPPDVPEPAWTWPSNLGQ